MKTALKHMAFAVFLFVLASSASRAAETTALTEHSMGSAKAPVTIIEYASLTCSHCADFHSRVLPELEKRYIETGKVRFIYRNFPLDAPGLKAAALTQCMQGDRYYPFVKILYANQSNWAHSTKPEAVLLQYAQMAGLDGDKAKACIDNTEALDALVAERTNAMEKYNITSTPTFLLNDGEDKIVGALSIQDFTTAIDKILAKKK